MVSSKKTGRAAARLTSELMLAPAVMSLRIPLLLAEAQSGALQRPEMQRAVNEKLTAAFEGMVAAQFSLASSGARFWFEMMSGKVPSLLNGAAVEHAMHAALTPSGKRVRQNLRRLTPK